MTYEGRLCHSLYVIYYAQTIVYFGTKAAFLTRNRSTATKHLEKSHVQSTGPGPGPVATMGREETAPWSAKGLEDGAKDDK